MRMLLLTFFWGKRIDSLYIIFMGGIFDLKKSCFLFSQEFIVEG